MNKHIYFTHADSTKGTYSVTVIIIKGTYSITVTIHKQIKGTYSGTVTIHNAELLPTKAIHAATLKRFYFFGQAPPTDIYT